MIRHLNKLTLILLFGLLMSCGGKEGVKAIFQNRTPYEKYSHNLKEANLHQTAMGQAWMKAGQQVLLDSVLITLPYQETGYFRAEKPAAASYAFKARRGELIDIKVTTRAKQDIKLFLDLFEKDDANPRKARHVLAADTTSLQLQHNVTEDLIYLVRLQPELLESTGFTITIATKPSLGFPVQGKNASAVQSFWGAERDGGVRKHEGVDIFAARGTPAIASTSGVISRVSETPIGGKVVWLTDVKNRQSLYYAHLDKQLVQPGQQVKFGDTLGLVGNTGNAKATPPHLHFGIYSYGYGAIDPFPFIYESDKKPAAVKINEQHLGEWGRVSNSVANLRKLPDGKAEVVAKLSKHTAFRVIAGTTNWYKVQMPGGLTGFVHKDSFESLKTPILTKALKTETEVTEYPESSASPVALLKKDSKITVLGLYQMFQLVRLADGSLGWLLKS